MLYTNFKKPSTATDSELTADGIITRYEGEEVSLSAPENSAPGFPAYTFFVFQRPRRNAATAARASTDSAIMIARKTPRAPSVVCLASA